MATRTVRLDVPSEKILADLVGDTGLSISAILRRGLLALRDQRKAAPVSAYEVYQRLDLGPGGYAVAPSTESRSGIRNIPWRR